MFLSIRDGIDLDLDLDLYVDIDLDVALDLKHTVHVNDGWIVHSPVDGFEFY